ncbi:MAG: CoB--CoM heterodisulfide reductase iron-sulfur subunit B family protein [Dehalococcoidia bacterium]|nr:CoB--CoM heterodisulfide reductase iron-sulfur subunit B family protein [Dehalococcoidia bacterium]
MNLSYYPGCTLKTKAKNLEDSAVASMAALGVNLVELPRWNCCGTVYSFAEDEELHQLAPVRNLIRVKEVESNKVVTICSFCYNTLKRANLLITNDPEKRNTLNTFMEEEIDYNGEVEVVHLLEVLRDEVGWQSISQKVQLPLKGLKVAPYYGCTLLRPQAVAIDNVERPTIMHDLLQALGAEVVDFPFATECCGSYQILSNPDFVSHCVWDILSSALRWGAEAVALSCPMCDFNLGQKQKELRQTHSGFKGIPILYFTQLLALSLGLDPEVCRFELNYVDPRPLLESKGLLRQ